MNIKKNISWIYFVSKRFSAVDSKGKGGVTSILSALGICFGVLTLIVTMAVMNGFQSGFINSILEISSFHVRVNPENIESVEPLIAHLSSSPEVQSVVPFFEAQSLVTGKGGRQQGALLRFIPSSMLSLDTGFASEINLLSGSFDLSGKKIVIGSALAKNLGVHLGDSVNLFALSGDGNVDLFSSDRVFEVSGIFYCDYNEINQTFAFMSLEEGYSIFGETQIPTIGVKLHNSQRDAFFINQIKDLKEGSVDSWRNYNRSFFGALRMEKNVLLLLVCLVFVVVGVNIYNSMRRMVFERKEDISVLTALGGSKKSVQSIFIFKGFLIGIGGAIPGLLAGLVISLNMDVVFLIISKIAYWGQYVITLITSPGMIDYVTENSMFQFYARIPAKPFVGETVFITLFGIFSAVIAAYMASKKILKMQVAEVLRYE
jgi:lipoprotein-releasing system permease protein